MIRGSCVMALGVASLLVWTAIGRSDDTIKLDLKDKNAAETLNLLGDGGADTLDVRWGWGGPRWGWGGPGWGWGWSGARWGWGWNVARVGWGWGGPGWGWGWNRPWAPVGVAFV